MQRVLSWSEPTIFAETSFFDRANASGPGRCCRNIKYNLLVITNNFDKNGKNIKQNKKHVPLVMSAKGVLAEVS